MNKDTENEFSLPFDEAAYRHISKLKKKTPSTTLWEMSSATRSGFRMPCDPKRNKDFDQILVRNRRTREIRILDFPGR